MEDKDGSTYLGDVLFPPTLEKVPYSNIPVRHGQGIWHEGRKGGDVYEGAFCMHKKHGVGTMEYRNGNTYIGEWRNNLWNGKARLQLWTKETYDGKFIAGKRNGYGLCTFANGSMYKGFWKNDQPDHFGEFIEANSEANSEANFSNQGQKRYIGAWQDGDRHGDGVVVAREGGEGGEEVVVKVDYDKGEPRRQMVVEDAAEKQMLMNQYMEKVYVMDRENKKKMDYIRLMMTKTKTPATGKRGGRAEPSVVTTPRRPDYLKRFYRK